MKARYPILNHSGYVLDSQELRILQKDGWLSLPLAEISEVKKPSLASAIVRFADGKKKILNLSHLSTTAFAVVGDALQKAARDYRVAGVTSQSEKRAEPDVRANGRSRPWLTLNVRQRKHGPSSPALES